MELMALSARLILENGGETYRVEETVRHIGKREDCRVEIIALPTAIFIMAEDPQGAKQTVSLPLSPPPAPPPNGRCFCRASATAP